MATMNEPEVEHEENVQVVMAMLDRVGTDGVLRAVAGGIRALAADKDKGSDWLIDLAIGIEALND